MMGPDSITYTLNPGALTFPDSIETAREMANILREEGADVIICIVNLFREPIEICRTVGQPIQMEKKSWCSLGNFPSAKVTTELL